MNTPTPRTDALRDKFNADLIGKGDLLAEYSKLETELNEARLGYEVLLQNYNADTISLVASERDQLRKVVDDWKDTSEMLMTVVCNSSGGDWKAESSDWQMTARKYVDEYYGRLKAHEQLPHVQERKTK